MRKELLLCAVLFVVGLSLYAADLNNRLFLDDEVLILNNDSIQQFSAKNAHTWFTENWFAGAGRDSEYYRPLVLVSYAANYAIHGFEPFGYLIANNVLHAVNAVLVYLLLRTLLRKRWLAFVTALVFLIHPMQSENVAYVAGRGDLMSSLFMIGGLFVWVKGIQHSRPVLSTIFASVLLIGALLSRENAIVFPFLAIVVYTAFLSRESIIRSVRAAVIRTSPFLMIVAGYFALRLTILNFRNFLNFGNYDTSSIYAQDILVRLYTFMHVLLEYVRTFLWPTNVHERFTFPIHTSFFDVPVWTAALVLVCITAILVVLYRKERSGTSTGDTNTSPFRLWLFAWGWFFVALAPASGIIPTNVIIQDHRLYLAMIGITVLSLWYGCEVINLSRRRGWSLVRPLVLIALVLYFCFFAWITVHRALIWGDPIRLFQETLRYEPDAVTAYSSLGKYYLDQGAYEEAGKNFLKAIQLGTSSPVPYYNMGYLYQYGPKHNLDAAIPFYKAAINLDPTHWSANYYLAEIYMLQGNAEAIVYLEKLHGIRPGNANIHYNLAAMHQFLGNSNDALAWIERGKQLAAQNTDDVRKFDELKSRILSQN